MEKAACGTGGDVIVVLTNLPDLAAARNLAQFLVEQRLAACVNVLAECSSVYRWRDGIETATEIPVLIKTVASCYPRVEAAIRANHPYELPEIVSVPVVAGLSEYLSWVAAESTAE
ncbi:MAG TPA: divalent-cation tolerance protein CutA [Burkholderiales bacterium]|nr:divalent-cation tolerance protein CutA [Burkholderiales bacterium]